MGWGGKGGVAAGVGNGIDEQPAILAFAQPEAAIPDDVDLACGIRLRVDRVAVVKALVIELARRRLAGDLEQPRLVKLRARRDCRPGHHGEVAESDLSRLHRPDACPHLAPSPADPPTGPRPPLPPHSR